MKFLWKDSSPCRSTSSSWKLLGSSIHPTHTQTVIDDERIPSCSLTSRREILREIQRVMDGRMAVDMLIDAENFFAFNVYE